MAPKLLEEQTIGISALLPSKSNSMEKRVKAAKLEAIEAGRSAASNTGNG